MMIKPGLNELMKMENVESRYTLVVAVAKRARELLNSDAEPLAESNSDKTVSVAINEMADGRIDVVPAPVSRANEETDAE